MSNKLLVDIEEFPMCCGMSVVSNFRLRGKSDHGYNANLVLEIDTPTEKIDEVIFDYVESSIHENNYSGYDGEHILCANISLEDTPREWVNYFENSKNWELIHSFVNCKTENTINHYQWVLHIDSWEDDDWDEQNGW